MKIIYKTHKAPFPIRNFDTSAEQAVICKVCRHNPSPPLTFLGPSFMRQYLRTHCTQAFRSDLSRIPPGLRARGAHLHGGSKRYNITISPNYNYKPMRLVQSVLSEVVSVSPCSGVQRITLSAFIAMTCILACHCMPDA